jgi:hypothetical protein
MTRGRKPLLERSISTNVYLPESWRTKLDLLLYSEVDGRVPKGAYQRFFIDRLADFFESRALDLGPYLGTLPGERAIRGRPATIEALEQYLQQPTSKEPA